MSGEEQLRRLSTDIRKAAATTGRRAQQVVRKTAYDIERTAKNLVPVDTGNLKSSIGHSDARSVGRSGTLAIEIGPTANYGQFVEFGTSRMAPQPYMGPAADKHEPAFDAAMAELGLEGLRG
jgi:HK97 gp10 family phage protein